MSGDYKSTVFLPRTGFPMKAGLPAREPEMLARWQAIGLTHLCLRTLGGGLTSNQHLDRMKSIVDQIPRGE